MEAKTKQEIIQYLTEMMGKICDAYWSGQLLGREPWVHERMDNSRAISIDLYHFCGDGLPVCDGLKPCTVTLDDSSQDTGNVFCMCYDPDDATPLLFLLEPEEDRYDYDIQPDALPEIALKNVAEWLEEQLK